MVKRSGLIRRDKSILCSEWWVRLLDGLATAVRLFVPEISDGQWRVTEWIIQKIKHNSPKIFLSLADWETNMPPIFSGHVLFSFTTYIQEIEETIWPKGILHNSTSWILLIILSTPVWCKWKKLPTSPRVASDIASSLLIPVMKITLAVKCCCSNNNTIRWWFVWLQVSQILRL
jgi:hypothetical protein